MQKTFLSKKIVISLVIMAMMTSLAPVSTNSVTYPNLNDIGNYTVKKGDSQTYKIENASDIIFKSQIPRTINGFYNPYNLDYHSGYNISIKVLSVYSNSTGRGVSYNVSYITPYKTYNNGPELAEPFYYVAFYNLGFFDTRPVSPWLEYIYPKLNSSDIQTLQKTLGPNNVTVSGDNITIKLYMDPLVTSPGNLTLYLENQTLLHYFSPRNLTYTFNYHTGWLEYYNYTNIYLNSTVQWSPILRSNYLHMFNSTQQLVMSIIPSSHKGLPGLTVLSVLPPLAVLVVITSVKRKIRK